MRKVFLGLCQARKSLACQSVVTGGDYGETEVQNIGESELGNEDDCRNDDAVDDALSVGGIEGIRYLYANVEKSFQFEGAAGDALCECRPIQEFHRDEGVATLFNYVVNGADIWMIQRRCRPGLALKSRKRLRIFANIIRQKFERYGAV